MKIYYIGRDENVCDIVIDDPSNITSGRHAVLKVDDKGRYTILDCSSNGTYVNGIRIEHNVEVSVTRKDVISFAHVVDLDWNVVENPLKKRRIVVFSSVIFAVLVVSIICMLFCFHNELWNGNVESLPSTQSDTLSLRDTALISDVSREEVSDTQCDTLRIPDTLRAQRDSQKTNGDDKHKEKRIDSKTHGNSFRNQSAESLDPSQSTKSKEKTNNDEPIAPTF